MGRFPHYKKGTEEIKRLLLQDLIHCGSVCTDKTLEEIIMDKRTEIIEKHKETHSIWQNKTTQRWCTKLGKEKRLIVRKEMTDLENAIIEFYLSDTKLTSTVAEVFHDWCAYEAGRTEHTMKTINEYTYDFRRFLADTEFSSLPIHNVTERDIIRLLKAIVHDGEKIPRKRYLVVKTILRTIFNHAKINMEIDCISIKGIMDDLRFPDTAFKKSTVDDNKEVFNLKEVLDIKESLAGTDDLLELGILLTLETGLRLGELCTLKRDCVTDGSLLIRRSEHKAKFGEEYRYYVGEPKKGKPRDVIMNADAKQVVNRILSLHDSEWLFPDSNDSSDWMRSYHFDKAIRRVCRHLGMPERSMHKLRKTFASILLQQKIDEKIVQKQLGHADISTTRRAYYYNVHDQEEERKILSSIRIG